MPSKQGKIIELCTEADWAEAKFYIEWVHFDCHTRQLVTLCGLSTTNFNAAQAFLPVDTTLIVFPWCK